MAREREARRCNSQGGDSSRGCGPAVRWPGRTELGPEGSLPEELPENRLLLGPVEDAAGGEVRPGYALRLSILKCVMRLSPENVARSLVEESPSFRSGLLALRLATLPALNSLAGEFNDAVAKACNETFNQVTNEYFLGMYKLITDWVGGKAAFGGDDDIIDTTLRIAKHDRNACCGSDFSDARRMASFSCFEPRTGDWFESLWQMPTPPRGRALTCVYPRTRVSSHPITLAERYDAYSARSRAPRGSVGAEVASVASWELGPFTNSKKKSSSRTCVETQTTPRSMTNTGIGDFLRARPSR